MSHDHRVYVWPKTEMTLILTSSHHYRHHPKFGSLNTLAYISGLISEYCILESQLWILAVLPAIGRSCAPAAMRKRVRRCANFSSSTVWLRFWPRISCRPIIAPLISRWLQEFSFTCTLWNQDSKIMSHKSDAYTMDDLSNRLRAAQLRNERNRVSRSSAKLDGVGATESLRVPEGSESQKKKAEDFVRS